MKLLRVASLLLSAASSLLLLSSTSTHSPSTSTGNGLLYFAHAQNNCPITGVSDIGLPPSGEIADCLPIEGSLTIRMTPYDGDYLRSLDFVGNHMVLGSGEEASVLTVQGAPAATGYGRFEITISSCDFGDGVGIRFVGELPASSVVTVRDNTFGSGAKDVDLGITSFALRLAMVAIREKTVITVDNNVASFNTSTPFGAVFGFGVMAPVSSGSLPVGLPMAGSARVEMSHNEADISSDYDSTANIALINIGTLRPQDGAYIHIHHNTARQGSTGPVAPPSLHTGVHMEAFHFSATKSSLWFDVGQLVVEDNVFSVGGWGVFGGRMADSLNSRMGGRAAVGFDESDVVPDFNGGHFTFRRNVFGGYKGSMKVAIELWSTPFKGDQSGAPRPILLTILNNTFPAVPSDGTIDAILQFRHLHPSRVGSGLVLRGNTFSGAFTNPLLGLLDSTLGQFAVAHFMSNDFGYTTRPFFQYLPLNFTKTSAPIFCNNTVAAGANDTALVDFNSLLAQDVAAYPKLFRRFFVYKCGCTDTDPAAAMSDPNALGNPDDWCRLQQYCGSFSTPEVPVMSDQCPSDAQLANDNAYGQLFSYGNIPL